MYLIIQYFFYATWHLMIKGKECQEHMTITFQAKKNKKLCKCLQFFHCVYISGEHEFHMV
jgi:hypothetical protein